MDLRVKSAREPATAADGARVLVDRLWPRGVSKARLALTHWAKDVAPSAELRTCVTAARKHTRILARSPRRGDSHRSVTPRALA